MLEIYTPATKQVRLPSYYVRHATNITKTWNKRHWNGGSRVSWIATGTMRYVHRLDSALKHKTGNTAVFQLHIEELPSANIRCDTTYVVRWGPMFKPPDRVPCILTWVSLLRWLSLLPGLGLGEEWGFPDVSTSTIIVHANPLSQLSKFFQRGFFPQ
jgi:hypothetical protein